MKVNPSLPQVFWVWPLALCLSTLTVTATGARAAQVTATWKGGAGNWSSASNWQGGVVPNNGTPTGTTYAVRLDNGNAAVSTVSLDVSVMVDTLTVSSGDTLGINNGQALTIATAGTLSNAGTIALNSSGASTDLRINGDITLNGGGAVTLSNDANNRIYGNISGTERLTNVDNTIQGAGNIGVNSMHLTNQGTILANVSAGLFIAPKDPSSNFNSGTMRADGGSTLTVNSSSFDNTGGTIRANVSTVRFNGTATISSGTVDVVGAGELRFTGGSVTGGTLTNSSTGIIRSVSGTNTIGGTVSNPAGGQIIVDNGSILRFTGGANSYSNAGSIALNSSGANTDLEISDDLSLTGGGTLTLSNNANNRIYGNAGTERLTNLNNTISGAGQIGVNFMRLTNQGTIIANASAGLIIDPNDPSNFNSGTMRADGGLTNILSINGGSLDNSGGTIRANTGMVRFNGSASITGGTVDVVGAGELRFTGGSVTGGTLTNSSTGIIRSVSGTNTIGGTVSNPAGGQIIVDNGTKLRFTGGAGNSYSNAGSIALNSSGANTDLEISADLSLTGGGTLTMSNFTTNRIYGSGFAARLTNVDNTISGSGNIGVDFMRLTNQSLILANASAGLTIDPNALSNVNSGTMRADGGSTLSFGGGTIDNTGGTIRANVSTVQFKSAASITGGTVDVVGAGELRFTGGSVTGGTLTNSSTGIIRSVTSTNTIGGTVSNPAGGQMILDNGTALALKGGGGNSYSNAGTIAMNSSGSTTQLLIGGDLTLTGGGTLAMSDNIFNRIQGQTTGSERLTNASGHTISGAGNIGVNNMALTNQGTIVVNVSNTLTIDPFGAANFSNTGTVRIDATRTMALGSGDKLTQTAGTTTVNGTLTASGGGVALSGGTLMGTGTVTGNVTNSGGTVAPGLSPGIFNVGNFSQSAGQLRIELNGVTVGTTYDRVNVTGTVTLGGSLNVTASFTPAIGATFTIIANDGTDAVTGGFVGLPQGAKLAANNVLFQISYTGGDGNDVTLTRIAPPTISINDVTVTEGTGTNKNANFTLTLSFASLLSVSVNAITANGAAKSPADYTGGGATLTFTPGQTSKTFSVPVIGDALDEDNETFFVLLSTPVNAAISRGRGICTITDNDAAPSITIEDVSIGEGNAGQRTATFRLHLSAPSGKLVKVNYATGIGTATAGTDYVAVGTTQIAFTTGQTVTLARVLINGDLLNEPDETFKVNLSGALNATIADNLAIGTILNDDPAPAISINDVSVTEGNSGTKNLTFTVNLTAPSGQSIAVNFATADGVARSATDYVAKTGTLTFAAGQTSKTISITINGDSVVESDETFFVLLSGANNASISKARGTGTITNDDASG